MAKPSKESGKNSKQKKLRIIILSGEKDPERAIFGLSYALSASALDYEVIVFLAMDGARLASDDLEDRILIDKYQSIPFYMKALLEANVKIGVCTTCIEGVLEDENHEPENVNFNVPASFVKARNLRKGIEVMGLAALFSPHETNTIIF